MFLRNFLTFMTAAVVITAPAENPGAAKEPFFRKAPKEMIVDLDFCTDVDDVMAVRMATELDKMGQIDLKGMALCTTGADNIEALHGLLSYDGYADLPIGASAVNNEDTSPYWDILARYGSAESLVKEKAVTLYRRLLASSEDKITIVTTGYLTNISELMKSGPDEISGLNGTDLLAKKCDAIYITGGSYPDGMCNNFFFTQSAREATAYVMEHTKTPLVFQTGNNGGPIKCGGLLQKLDTARKDPAAKALDAFGTSDGRASWDPMTVWAAAFSPEDTRFTVTRVNMYFNEETGFNAYEEREDGEFFLLHRLDNDLDWYRDRMDNITVRSYQNRSENQTKDQAE